MTKSEVYEVIDDLQQQAYEMQSMTFGSDRKYDERKLKKMHKYSTQSERVACIVELHQVHKEIGAKRELLRRIDEIIPSEYRSFFQAAMVQSQIRSTFASCSAHFVTLINKLIDEWGL